MKTRSVATVALLAVAAILAAIVSLIGWKSLPWVLIALEPTRHQNALVAQNLLGTWAIDCGRSVSPGNMQIVISRASGIDGFVAYRFGMGSSDDTLKVLSADLVMTDFNTRLDRRLIGDDETVGNIQFTQLAGTGLRSVATLAMAIDGKQGVWGKMTVASWQRADGTFEVRNGLRSADQTAYGWLKRCGGP
jgi:hypothetical protein